MVKKRAVTRKRLTLAEKKKMKEMISVRGGSRLVDKAKIRARILALRKRKTNRTTRRDMEDMFGY